ncbi:UNVERIFIED_CONTAM: hypothetical protein Slati_0171100 [Sesamum latifolium]|uniref:Uncharacterized protein n=1 Tax=Sesamum latifolium TaxID=2727402 RepID=A0AAW2YAH8_9LAMI
MRYLPLSRSEEGKNIFYRVCITRRSKKACREEEGSEGRYCSKSEEDEYTYPFDSESLDEFEEGESDEGKEDSAVRKSFSYGTLAYANYAGVSCYSSARINNEDEDWIYYSNRRTSDAGCSHVDDPISKIHEHQLIHNSKRSILPWRKRKLSFRQLSSDESLSSGVRVLMLFSSLTKPGKQLKLDEDSNANRSSVSEFGEDSFAVGTWEQKEITSRDGHMKIQAQSQFDSLIRDGSLEWRNLCEHDIYRERFPDKHFDLRPVLQAKVRDLCVASEKSFIGFPSRCYGSWNDHFFILKVEADAYYIIDTLGERLHEGCNQAYILKF